MVRLSQRDLNRIDAFLRVLYAQTDFAALREQMLVALADLIPCEWASYNEGEPTVPGAGFFNIRVPDRPECITHQPIVQAYIHQHPVTNLLIRQGRTGALTLSDVVSSAELNRLELYNEYYKVVGCRYQMAAMFFNHGGFVRALAINRENADFTARECQIVSVLNPHLLQACRNAQAFTEARRALKTLEYLQVVRAGAASAVITVTADGRAIRQSEGAGELVARCFREVLIEGQKLPETLLRWFSHRQQMASEDLLQSAAQSTAEFDGGRLRLQARLARTLAGEFVLLLEQREASIQPHAEDLARLTAREIETLRWVAEGKTNPEIAVILGISPRTVDKHVEHLLAKLALENRAAAMLWFNRLKPNIGDIPCLT